MTRKEQRRGSDEKARILDAIVSSRSKSAVLDDRRQIRRYLEQYFAHVPVEDLQGRSERIMARIALEHLEFGARRKRGEALLRIYNPDEETHGYTSKFTFIEMVNDDMPFLVDSVTAAINRRKLSVHITVHPVIRVRRDKRGKLLSVEPRDSGKGRNESLVRFAVDRESDPARRRVLEKEIRKVLSDVRAAVRDWKEMRDKMQEARDSMSFGPPGVDEDLRDESRNLLDWMVDDRFTFLGYREYRLAHRGKRVFLRQVDGTGLGLLASDDSGNKEIELTPEMRRLTRSKDWLIITKANSRSTVHRSAYLDYIGLKQYDESGKTIGEHRFIGLFTSAAYSESPRNIPLLRLKIQKVLDRNKVDPRGHRGKALLHILDTFPRDELFQSSISDLARTTLGVLNLQERQRVRFFLRRDTFRRFYSCLIYVPREKYTTAVRREMESILLHAFDGTSVDSSVQIFDSPHARLHAIVRTDTGDRPRVSIQRIEEKIAEVVVTWADHVREELQQMFGVDEGDHLFRAYGRVFPAGYEEDTAPRDACSDISRIDSMRREGEIRTVNLYKPEDAEAGHVHFLIYGDDKPLSLSDAMPILENMGVDVYTERPYELMLNEDDPFWIQDFHLRYEGGSEIDITLAARRFEECFMRVLELELENDGLNRLILAAELDWRQTALLRCYTKYLQQLGMPFSQSYMEDVLVAHAGLVRLLVSQFTAQFDPAIKPATRTRKLNEIAPQVKRAVSRARGVDEDRILNAFAGAVRSTLRTNYFLADDGEPKPYISIKLDPSRIPEMPLPKPRFEIFVYSPDVEGVHLRGGEIARGGLRWSDRREDFRTEVLGLMKAQIVKNTVIVPTGAKGGFFCKRLPTDDRDAMFATGVECYKTFICGLLDITDNVVDGEVIPPEKVVRRDDDDPYLVVAADKGTATFSDIANGISVEYGFWLDDAFASGGSAGYDHKKMGITARGAWEAVKRHFREQGLNTQKDPFTAVGIGDMSGDVFGNGMLLSRKIRLVAAFNHMHVFLDPEPDTAASYRERQRLFRKGRSSWEDYDESVISKGGGIFSRQAKTIRLSKNVRTLLGTEETSMQPDELIRAILKMKADLLWNGGIGTYVKASAESHSDVGDRSNDRVRVNANELGCRVVGEGGNLGLTQRARIEFSLNGGRINTDFIDNSAGVDSSDREVNIKILLSDAAKEKDLSREDRDDLLASMTDDVANLVLRNNYLQTQAISMSEIRSLERIDETARLITNLERTGLLDRGLEYLPDDVEIEERRARKQGFTRPELAVVLSYAKIDLYNGLAAANDTLEDFLAAAEPLRYFPPVLRERYADLLPTHRLSREILATLIANNLVNRMGPAFVKRIQVDTNAGIVTIARAYTVARQICRASDLFETIESLDHKIPASAQMSMMFEVARTLRHASYWLIERFGDGLSIQTAAGRLKDGMTAVYSRTTSVLSSAARERHENAARHYVGMGVPEKLADRMSALLLTRAALDIADLAAEYGRDVLETAKIYSAFNDSLRLYWLHNSVEDLEVQGRWQAVARSHLREEFYQLRRVLASQLLKKRSKRDMNERVAEWLDSHADEVAQFKQMTEEMRLRDEIDFATLTVAAQELRELVTN